MSPTPKTTFFRTLARFGHFTQTSARSRSSRIASALAWGSRVWVGTVGAALEIRSCVGMEIGDDDFMRDGFDTAGCSVVAGAAEAVGWLSAPADVGRACAGVVAACFNRPMVSCATGTKRVP